MHAASLFSIAVPSGLNWKMERHGKKILYCRMELSETKEKTLKGEKEQNGNMVGILEKTGSTLN